MGTYRSVRDLTAAGKRIGFVMLPDAVNRIELPDQEIEVWLARLDLGIDDIAQCMELLSSDEQLRAGRFHFERDRRRFIVARGVLRMLLGNHLDIAPAAVAFGYTQHGKPFVINPASQIHFNLSHSGERALIALSISRELGVDIEDLNREIDYSELATRFFAPRECAALMRIAESNRKRAFVTCWTRKEALVKAMGGGLSLPLDQFEVTLDPDVAPRVLDFAVPAYEIVDWKLHSIAVGGDYVATVAACDAKIV
jgi:4'-phosphopantetheinyl transferase